MTKLEMTTIFKAIDLFLKDGNLAAVQEIVDHVLNDGKEPKEK